VPVAMFLLFLRYVGVREILEHGLPLAPAIPNMYYMKRVLIKPPTEPYSTFYWPVCLKSGWTV
jgi:hypothetical protein